MGRRDDEASRGRQVLRLGRPLRLVDVSQDAAGALEVARASIREGDRARRALEQAETEPLFERCDQACDRRGSIDGRTRARLALTVAELNGCTSCLSAHTYLGKNAAKLDDAEMAANREGGSSDPQAAAAVRFAAQIVRERGHVSEADVQAVKAAD
jgi:AhpD family alkylhydroperoxidase